MSTFKFTQKLRIPTLVSTEQAVEWGSHLNAEQHAMLVEAQRSMSNAALGEFDLQRMIDLGTQSRLMRVAGEVFAAGRKPVKS